MFKRREKNNKEKLIIYGLEEKNLNLIIKYFPLPYYDIVACTDDNKENYVNTNKLNVQYLDLKDINTIQFDKIIITDLKKSKEMCNRLVNDYNIKNEKIISYTEYINEKDLKEPLFEFNFGVLNDNVKFYVMIPAQNTGLFWMFNYVIRQLKFCLDNKLIPVIDMQNYKNLYLDENSIGLVNAWENYFEPLSKYKLSEVYSSECVIIGSNNMNVIKYDNFHMSDRQYIYKNYIHERNELIKKVNKEYRKLFPKKNKVLGILCRGTDYIYAKPKDHAIPIDVFEMIEIAKQYVAKYKYEYIYLCTEDEYILNKFQDVFKSRLLFTSQNRYTDTGDSRLAVIMRENTSKKRVNEEYLRGEEYYVTIALLAKCDRLLATHCGGTTGVVTINGSKYKECRILGKGFWNQNGKYPLVVESRNKNLIKLQLDKLPNCQDGIKIIKLINGRLKLDGTAERDTSIKLCEYTQIYLKPFVDFRISIYGFKEFDVNDAHLTLKLYDSRYLEDKSTGITFCCLDNKSYNFDVPIIAYEVYTVIKQNVKINEEVYVQFEQSSEISNYVEGICSETEIALKDDKNNYYELINKDYIDLNNFIMYINGNAIKLANSEIIKLKNVIKYEGGILNYRYKNNFIGYEEKCVRFTYNDRLL